MLEAIADCTQAIRLNPAYAEPYINRGYAQFRLGKTKADHGDMTSVQELYTAAVEDVHRSDRVGSRECIRLWESRVLPKLHLVTLKGQ